MGIYWQLHHILPSYLSYVNQRLVNLNLLFLFALTLLPFFAKLKNTFPEDPVVAQIFGLHSCAQRSAAPGDTAARPGCDRRSGE